MRIVTGEQMRAAEAAAIHELGIPSLLLMENAALQTVAHIRRLLEAASATKRLVTVVCGPGNNGGDGFAIARLLWAQKINVSVILAGLPSRLKGDAKVNFDILRRTGVPLAQFPMESETPSDATIIPRQGKDEIAALLQKAGLVVDALFGTGFHPVTAEDPYNEIIDMINTHASEPVVSVDVPSGLDADTGHVTGPVVRAHTTITYGFPKVGLLLYPGVEYAGDVRVEAISVPESVLPANGWVMETWTDADIPSKLPARPPLSHKGSFGRVCVLAGSRDMPGAAVLCCEAAYRIGAGLVEACAVKEVIRAIQLQVPEAITSLLPEKNGRLYAKSVAASEPSLSAARVVLLGPGLGQGAAVRAFVSATLTHARCPVVLDADGLNAVSEDISLLKNRTAPCAMTPHPGEMSRLTGRPVSDITANPIEIAAAFAREHQVITLLKGARTVIAAPDGRIFINTTGNASMAKAGSGDALAGMIAGLAAQGTDLLTACVLGAYLHGKAGELAAKTLSLYGVTASDLIKALPRVLAAIV